jgi:phosphate transport system substrate-binding protein
MSRRTDAGRTLARRTLIWATVSASWLGLATTVSAQQANLLETGSSLLYPLFNLWVPAYTKLHPGVQITTQSTGSGTGISEAVAGIAQIGASDAYMSNALMKLKPGMLNIPLAISSQMVNYNVPGLNDEHLKLSGPVLSGIYQGKIKTWNDPQIAKLNLGAKLPDNPIITVHRTDGSGDTFIFTQFLSASTPEWQNSIAYGTTVSWPAAPGAIGATGNQGMISALQHNQYSIAYVGISFESAITAGKLGTAQLANKAGKFVLPNAQTVQAAANATEKKTPPDERLSLIFAPGEESYPIINYEYAIVKEQQPSPQVASTLRSFLTWAISPEGGSSSQFLKKVNFVALPESVVKLSTAQIDRIK